MFFIVTFRFFMSTCSLLSSTTVREGGNGWKREGEKKGRGKRGEKNDILVVTSQIIVRLNCWIFFNLKRKLVRGKSMRGREGQGKSTLCTCFIFILFYYFYICFCFLFSYLIYFQLLWVTRIIHSAPMLLGRCIFRFFPFYFFVFFFFIFLLFFVFVFVPFLIRTYRILMYTWAIKRDENVSEREETVRDKREWEIRENEREERMREKGMREKREWERRGNEREQRMR